MAASDLEGSGGRQVAMLDHLAEAGVHFPVDGAVRAGAGHEDETLAVEAQRVACLEGRLGSHRVDGDILLAARDLRVSCERPADANLCRAVAAVVLERDVWLEPAATGRHPDWKVVCG